MKGARFHKAGHLYNHGRACLEPVTRARLAVATVIDQAQSRCDIEKNVAWLLEQPELDLRVVRKELSARHAVTRSIADIIQHNHSRMK